MEISCAARPVAPFLRAASRRTVTATCHLVRSGWRQASYPTRQPGAAPIVIYWPSCSGTSGALKNVENRHDDFPSPTPTTSCSPRDCRGDSSKPTWNSQGGMLAAGATTAGVHILCSRGLGRARPGSLGTAAGSPATEALLFSIWLRTSKRSKPGFSRRDSEAVCRDDARARSARRKRSCRRNASPPSAALGGLVVRLLAALEIERDGAVGGALVRRLAPPRDRPCHVVLQEVVEAGVLHR